MLTLFRLHMKNCSAGRPRLDRNYRKCHCPIHVKGKCGTEFVRKGVETASWQRAQQRVMEAEARGSWDPLPEERKVEPTTIAEAKQRFLQHAETGRRLGESTLSKYKLMLRQLEDFAAKKGFRYLKQLDVEFLRQFRDSCKIGPRTALKKIERVRAFFRFAVDSDWIEKNPAKLVRGAATIKDTQKLPFEPKEMERIIDACRKVGPRRCSNDELLAFVLVLRYSGLRIGDASLLTADRFKENDLNK